MELKNQGFKPILAHPERYTAMQEDREKLRELRENGILMQVNAYDLELNLNPSTRNLAQWMAKERIITFIGSDMHGSRPPKHLPMVSEGVRWLYENTDEEYAKDVTFRNAEKYLGAKIQEDTAGKSEA